MLRGSAAKACVMDTVSTTHGNRIGQRTYFPAFSCSGYTRTITTPSNVHVCPPTWFTLFLLDSNSVPAYCAMGEGQGEIQLGWACEVIRPYNGMPIAVMCIEISNSE